MTMKTYAANYFSPSRILFKFALTISLLLGVMFTSAAQAAITVTPTSMSPTSPVFYTDAGAGPKCNYMSFNVTTTTSISDAWVTIGNFGGVPTYLSMGGGDNGATHFGPMTAGETRTAFFYVCSTFVKSGGTKTAAGQTFNITTYSGNPLFGGTSLGVTNLSATIDDGVIQSANNTVNAIWADINPSVLGATTTLTVDGDTGTLGCVNPPSTCTANAGPLVFSPATFIDWRADAYELVGSSIVLSGGNSGTYNNALYLDNVVSGSTTHYNAIYYFRPVATTASTTTLSPVSYLASGTQMKHTNLSSGVYAGAGGLLPILPAQNTVILAKSVSHATLPAQGGTVTYTVSATNTGSYDLSLDSFNDVLPPGATYVPGSTTFNDFSFVDPVISGSNVTWSSFFTIPGNSTRTLIYQVILPATPGTYTNSATARIDAAIIDTTLSTSDNAPPTATTLVLKAPTIAKSFTPNALAAGATSVLTLTIGNPNTTQTLNGIAVSDTLPAGMVFASPPNVATSCSGATLNLTGTTFSISGGTLAAAQNCTVTVNVTSSTSTSYTNTTGTISSDNGGTGTTASATVSFSPKPAISKSFSVSTIPKNGTATLTFTIKNNTTAVITGLTFTDTYPVNLVNAATPGITNTCGGAITAAAGGGSLSLSGGSIATAGGTCTISVVVTSATAGVYANTAGGVNSNEVPPAGPASNTATLVVMGNPTVAKAFSPTNIGKGQTATLTITLTNPNTVAITGAAFTDTYPTNLITAAVPNASTTCVSGTVGSTAGSVSLSGATIPASSSCTVKISVTSNVVNLIPGYVNTIAIGAVTTTNAGSNTAAASATLLVSSPTIDKSFTFNPVTGIATMSFTVSNNDVVAATAISFTDLFPANMRTDNPPLATATPCGVGSSLQSWNGAAAGILTATGGDPGIKLTAGTLAAGASCTFSINMTVDALGVFNNQTSNSTGSYGTGSASNIATWISPSVSKIFLPTQVGPTMVGPSDPSRLIITITNPSTTTTLTGLTISDTYPISATKLSGGVLAAAITSPIPNASNTCGGTVTATATGISLSGGMLAPGASCSIAADVVATDTTPAMYLNSTSKAASNQGIGVSGSATLAITTSPLIKKSFLASPVTISGGIATSTMRIVVENNAGIDITALTFSDTFPTSPSQMKWVSTVANTCGGTLTDVAGAALVSGTSTGIKLTGGAITALAVTCTIDVSVSVSLPGTYYNTTSGATSSANTTVGPVSTTATLVVHLAAPTVTKSFANAGFQVGGSDRLTITLTNPNTTAITGAAFTDTYPANMINAASPGITNSCGGTATAAAGANKVSLSGGSIPASGSCTVQVNVTATTVGAYTNTLAINSVTSTNADPGPAAAATASASAYLPPTVTKSFGTAVIGIGGSTSLTLTLTNPASNTATLTTLQVDDTFPAGMTLQNTTFSYTPLACGTVTKTTGAASAVGDSSLRFSVASLAAGASCQVSVNITSSMVGAVTNTTNSPLASGPATLSGIAALASMTVSNAPSITLLKTVAIYSDPVNLLVNPKFIPGGVAQYTIIANNSGGPADNNSTLVTDPIPVNTLLGNSGQVTFIQGATSSTLTYNAATDLTYSNDGGATWLAPAAIPATFNATTGCDTTVPPITHIRINPKGTFVGGIPNPSFQLAFRVCIK